MSLPPGEYPTDRPINLDDYDLVESIAVMAVGHDKGGREPFRNDAIAWKHYGADKEGFARWFEYDTYEKRGMGDLMISGSLEAFRAAWNLVLLWNSLEVCENGEVTGPIEKKLVTPKPVKDRDKRTLKRMGRSCLKYFDLTLRSRPQRREKLKALSGYDGPYYDIVVPGGYQNYWMLEENVPKGYHPLGTKLSPTGKPLCKVRKYKRHYDSIVRGERPEIVQPRQVRR
jgi:hypothetical protein